VYLEEAGPISLAIDATTVQRLCCFCGNNAKNVLSGILLDAGALELLPLPISTPILVKLLLGILLSRLGAADLLDEVVVLSAGLEKLRAI
jgi:hypothetical protein